jgi:hypothetical protein
MEAATPLRKPSVRTVGDRVAVDGLVVEDEATLRLVREREESGEDTVKLALDALEIGARVLDREQAGANAEFVKAEMEKAARELDGEFAERARELGEDLDRRLSVFLAPDGGSLPAALERLFSDGSSDAVQHRVRELVTETMAKTRADLVKQFSAADDSNPLADLKQNTVNALKGAAETQDKHLRALHAELATVKQELQGLRDERRRVEELAEAEDAGTRKGRTYEESVFEAIDAIASAQGDTAEPVGDVKEATGKTGDVVVGIDGCSGPAVARIVFEAKNAQLTRPKALRELDDARAERNADFAVLVVPGEEKIPAKMTALREYNGDKLIVTYDPEEGSSLALEVAYGLARARVLMARGAGEGVDAGALRDTIERALTAMEDVRKIKLQLTGATNGIDQARGILDEMAGRVRELLDEMSGALAAADEDAGGDRQLFR